MYIICRERRRRRTTINIRLQTERQIGDRESRHTYREIDRHIKRKAKKETEIEVKGDRETE